MNSIPQDWDASVNYCNTHCKKPWLANLQITQQICDICSRKLQTSQVPTFSVASKPHKHTNKEKLQLAITKASLTKNNDSDSNISQGSFILASCPQQKGYLKSVY